MIKKLLKNSSTLLTRREKGVFSAATIVMVMIAFSRILGLVRNRILAHFFSAEELSIYFAAFRLPEVVFEVLIFGTLASAFIPTFTSFLSSKDKKEAWYMACAVLNSALVFFLFFAVIFFVFSRNIYQIIASGFNQEQINLIAKLARILLLAQGFFVLSYFLTAILESLQRFLIPAISPLFYNLGIILGTLIFANKIGIYSPTIGAVIGAFFHFAVQLPLARHLGFRNRFIFNFSHPGVKEVGRLAVPRIIELSFLQIGKSAELLFASLVSAAAYTYYTFANSLQLLPVGLFGVSVAKASLPVLSYQRAKGELEQFREIFVSLFNEIIFLTLPCAIFLAVLRIPAVRLVFGATRFNWESTVQTGYALSAFCLGIPAQSLIYLLTRAFYAFHDVKTPVKIAVATIFLNIALGAFLILWWRLPIWSLALAFSLTSIFQMFCLIFAFSKKFIKLETKRLTIPFLKILFASLFSGWMMYFFLKILDRSAWDKKLSFLGKIGLALPVAFDRFILDTRFTLNLIFLTFIVGIIGATSYLTMSKILAIKELEVFGKFLKKFKRPKILKLAQLNHNDMVGG